MKNVELILSNTESFDVPNRVLVFSPEAASCLLKDTIGWGRFDMAKNKREQGGWLIGCHFTDKHGTIFKSEVHYILEAQADVREPGYIEWSAMEDIRLQRAFFALQHNIAETDPEKARNLELIGWWHTHPNNLPVFLSGTDRSTIQSKFNKPGHYSVVLNPHRKIWRVFVDFEPVEIHGLLPLTNAMEKADRTMGTKKRKGSWNKRKRKILMRKQKRRM